MATSKSWERQKGETEKAYEAFYIYLQMGKERAVRKVEQELHKSHQLIARWSSDHNWVKRARDYDNYLIQLEMEAQQKVLANMRKRQIQTAVLLQKKAVEALDQLDISSLKPQQILSFITAGAALEKQTRSEERMKESENTQTLSLADTIIAAYKRRTEADGDDD